MAIDLDVHHTGGTDSSGSIGDWRIGDLAERQGGVVSRAQLAALGVSRRAIEHRIRTGRLRPVHRGVFAVGHRVLGRSGVWTASSPAEAARC